MYIYPLVDQKRGGYKLLCNLFIVWCLTGIWHGASANFLAWGIGYFLLIAFEKLSGYPKKFKSELGKIIYRIGVLIVINFQWVLFRAEDFKKGITYIKCMICMQENAVADARACFLLKDNWCILLLAILFCFPIVPWIQKKCEKNVLLENVYNVVFGIVLIGLFAVSIALIVVGQSNPFAYANF